ncbi:MAG TPA: THUMP domain-containing protein [Spirochaetota bacterium]|nr:THUMP domain-containing protein [Spirochaetota bacterium]HOH36369.1 THUMP domain-containing protein [Spirochaetota bacterium]HPY03264.1 THUMP domain-containing protein [Spirochaetota bacterium]HQA52102.1 THUMP domain-containing protein [Spirochaetota bacterium]
MSEPSIEKRVKRHIKAKTHNFFAVYPPGFSECAEKEISKVEGAENISVEYGGINFSGKMDTLYRTTLQLRGSARILMRITEFHAENFRELKRKTESVPWELYAGENFSFDYSVSCEKSRLYHSGAVEETLKEAMHNKTSDQGISHTIFARIVNDRCTLSIDTSGDPLYKRGYKIMTPEAPLRENICAMILNQFPLNKYSAIIDPMCGGGTFTLEACSLLGHISPFHENRIFAFQKFPVYSEKTFLDIKRRLSVEKSQTDFFVFDINDESIKVSLHNFSHAGITEIVKTEKTDFFSLQRKNFPDGKILLVLNPPYGKRIETDDSIFRKIYAKLKNDFSDASFAVILPDNESEIFTERFDCKRIMFSNGGIKVSAIIREV